MSGMFINHNFAKSALAAGIADSDLALDLVAGDGAKFPTTGDFLCVLWDSAYASPVSDPDREIIKVTDRSTDALTIVRAQESTVAKAWNADDHCALVITAGKIDELEDEIAVAQTGANLLQNASFAITPATTKVPDGWTLAGAGATITLAAGDYGYRKLTLTAGAGAPATLTQALGSDVPTISDDYSISAFASVDAGGTGSLALDTLSVAVTNTTAALKSGSGSVTAHSFVMTIDATHALTVELPTVTLGRNPAYPMYSSNEAAGHSDLGHPKRGLFRGEMADSATKTFDLAILAPDSANCVLGVTVYWQSVTTTGYGGLLFATQYRTSGGTFKGPNITVVSPTGGSVKGSVTSAAGYVCLYDNSNVLTLYNRLGETIRVIVDYIWG